MKADQPSSTPSALSERTLAELEEHAAGARQHAINVLTAAGIPDPEHWLDLPVPPKRGSSPRALRWRIGERDGWICCICRKPIDPDHAWQPTGATDRNHAHPSIEHLLPVCVGGTDDPDNLAIAHHGCNAHQRDPGVYVEAGYTANRAIIKAVGNAKAAATVAAAARTIAGQPAAPAP